MGKTLFICYAEDDRPWLDRLTKQLASLRNDGVLSEVWDDRHLRALDESEWEAILLPKLKPADCIIILLSANSAASNYIQTTELPIALERKASGDAKVMLVYLKPYPIENRLQAFQIRPSVEVAVTETHDPERALAKIANEIREALQPPPTPNPAVRTFSEKRNQEFSHAPFLINRHPQKTALRPLCERMPRRPLAFIVSGPDHEVHQGFHDAIAYDFLPRWVTGVQGLPVHRRVMPWPSESDDFKYPISEALCANTSDSTRMARGLLKGLTYLTTTIYGDELPRNRQRLQDFFAYWNQWPDLASNRALCVAVSVEWRDTPPSESLEKLYLPAEYPALRFGVLQSLRPPEQTHAEDWVYNPTIKSLYDWSRRFDLLSDVNALFPNGNPVKMRDLHKPLVQTLGRYSQ